MISSSVNSRHLITMSLVLCSACSRGKQIESGALSGSSSQLTSCTRLAKLFEKQLKLDSERPERSVSFRIAYLPPTKTCYLEEDQTVQTDFIFQRDRTIFNLEKQSLVVGCSESSSRGSKGNPVCRQGALGQTIPLNDAKYMMDALMSERADWP